MFFPDVFGNFRPGPALLGTARREGRNRGLNRVVNLCQLEGVDHVPQPEHAVRTHNSCDPRECDGLPEVREVVQRVAAVDGVDRSPKCS